MLTKFRKNHIHSFFQTWETNELIPLEAVLNQYLRRNKSIGSKDRKEISEIIYNLVRWKELFDAHIRKSGKKPRWDKRLEIYLNNSLKTLKTSPDIAKHEQLGFSKELYSYLVSSMGEEQAEKFCKVSQTRAPIFVRTNLCKTSREALFYGWKNRYDVSLCQTSKSGIIFHEKINFFILPEFKKGLFEVQDEASQLVADLVDAKPGDEVLDYCAGAGGKSLAFAHKLEGKGQIFLYDLRLRALASAKQRLRRCGVQNSQIVTEAKALKRLKNRMNWVLLDVPCSGSGTWRRKPDQRWRFSKKMISNLVDDQRKIFDQALKYVAPGGKIVYSTCSIFDEENERQVEYFCNEYGLKAHPEPFKSFPEEGKMDGFYATIISS